MQTINFKATNSTPSVKFGEDNKLEIKGRSISENDFNFYQPLIDWAKMLQVNSLVVDLKLEYMNSSSSKKIFYLLKVLDSNKHVNNRVINWYYEEGDEDALLKGQVFHEALTNTTFKFFLNRETN